MDERHAEEFYAQMDGDLRYHYWNLVRGAIFGQAIGDALGHPIEFEKTHEVVDLEEDNKFTDDTQMFCAIGEAMLIAPPHKGVEAFMDALTQEFIAWRANPLGGSHRAPGGTCMEAVRKLGAGRHWVQSGATRDGKGNGSAMRAGIVGARYWKEPTTAFDIGCLTSINTHNNLESILSAGMVAFLVAKSIAGASWPEAVAEGLRLCSEFEHRVHGYPTNNVPMNNTREGQSPWRAIANFARGYVLGQSDIPMAQFIKENGNDFTSVPAVSEAIFFNTRFDNYDDMVLKCANVSDDSDTITAIAGTIAGARFGFTDIDRHSPTSEIFTDLRGWADRIELRDYLEDLSKRIFEASLEEGELAERLAAQSVDEALGEEYDGHGDETSDEEFIVPGEVEEAITTDDGEDFEVEF